MSSSISFEGCHFSLSTVIYARSQSKAVFNFQTLVTKTHKVMESTNDLRTQFLILKYSQIMNGIPSLLLNDLVECKLSNLSGDIVSWKGIATSPYGQPYGQVLTYSEATPTHFAQYARILSEAVSRRYVHNDLSPDNLLLVDSIPWEMARPEGSFIGKCGKSCYYPLSLSNEATGELKVGRRSLDLETLFLVTVCCALEKVPWRHYTGEKRFQVNLLTISSDFAVPWSCLKFEQSRNFLLF